MHDTDRDRRSLLSGMAMAFAAAQVGIGDPADAQALSDSRLALLPAAQGSEPRLRVPFLHGVFVGPSAGQAELAAVQNANEWLNSPPLPAAALRGKPVLINFWTYTCMNWRRTLPYVRAWAEKYNSEGLVVIGVHSPEFVFEKNIDNVRLAVKEMQVHFPVVLDSQHVIWRAFQNQYWPALYFVDAGGRVRYHQFGEGAYEQSEMVIQALLREAGVDRISREPVSLSPVGFEAPADWGSLMSPENYVGYGRTENFVSPGGAVPDRPSEYQLPDRIRLNHWALLGEWTLRNDAVVLNEAGGRIAYNFHARDLHLVMGSGTPGTRVRFRVVIDGHRPGASHGLDIDEAGDGVIVEQRLYQLIRQPKPIADKLFTITFYDSGAEAFAFTFG